MNSRHPAQQQHLWMVGCGKFLDAGLAVGMCVLRAVAQAVMFARSIRRQALSQQQLGAGNPCKQGCSTLSQAPPLHVDLSSICKWVALPICASGGCNSYLSAAGSLDFASTAAGWEVAG